MDALGRTLKVEQKAADLAVQILEYSYATNGFVKTMKYPSGRVVSYAQSNAGRTLSASGSGAGEPYASGLTYGANGALLGAVWNGDRGDAGGGGAELRGTLRWHSILTAQKAASVR